MTAPILIIDDEPAIRRLLRGSLERAGWRVDDAATASAGVIAAQRPGCELVLLDLGLPDRDGLELIPLLKAHDRAVIVLTARDATIEKVAALDLGADDYVTKPFDTEELLARIRAALRHRTSRASERLAIGDIIIDLSAHSVTRDGHAVPLTRKEFAVLVELARNAGRVLTHTSLLRAIWGEAHIGDIEYLRIAVRALRLKLEAEPSRPQLIINEPGIGYRVNC